MKKYAGDGLEFSPIGYEDTTCEIYCDCGYGYGEKELIWASNSEIVRCPKCGKGYKVEFVVWQYEKNEE
jgi:hypothetical protein